jgi:hypothetical protein
MHVQTVQTENYVTQLAPTHLPAVVRPRLSLADSIAYSGWRLTQLSEMPERSTYAAFKADDIEHTYPAVTLASSATVFCEGYWPFRPTYAPQLILGGVCLYTAAWAIRFTGAGGHGHAPRALSLGLPGDLARILRLLEKGRPIESIELPTRPGLYHQRLITWQAEILGRFPSVERIRYTLPIHDYRGYIMQLETALGYALPGMHMALDKYVQAIKAYLQQVWGDLTHKVEFDTRGSAEFKKADATSRENDLRLYLDAVQCERVMGMEDLPEVALSHEVARRKNVMIPCAVAVLGIPDPYTAREDPSYACRSVPIDELR